ncbi:MAG TPA: AzlC family ABC transporter permease [Microthrixaceae bacterium]|nr:AzlC family ABC transporter permease [Microthrixaceae bacterium]
MDLPPGAEPDPTEAIGPSRFGGFRAGFVAVAPLLVGVAPFGLVAGATPVAYGLGADAAVGFSVIMFAGASQLASIEVLGAGGSVLAAVLTACTINLRLILYSASCSPYLRRLAPARRMVMAYLLTDEAYALSIVRWSEQGSEAQDPPTLRGRWTFYMGAAASMWATWQVSTLVGILVGNALPSGVRLDVIAPLVFLVLLVPTLVTRAALVAAAVGGVGAVVAAECGAGPMAVVVGSVAGILAGAALDDGAGDGAGGGAGGGAEGDDGRGHDGPTPAEPLP